MPKTSLFPTLFDEVLQLNVTKLNRWGYFKPNHHIKVNFFWGKETEKRGEISAWINTMGKTPYIILDYNFRGNPRNYKVHLTSIPSNLGKGKIWYFICPYTGKKCRQLYSVGGYFLHREAHQGCFYEKQTYSKNRRWAEKHLGKVFGRNKASEKIYSKHFKKYYAGKPTKRYLRLWKQMKEGENFTYRDWQEVKQILL